MNGNQQRMKRTRKKRESLHGCSVAAIFFCLSSGMRTEKKRVGNILRFYWLFIDTNTVQVFVLNRSIWLLFCCCCRYSHESGYFFLVEWESKGSKMQTIFNLFINAGEWMTFERSVQLKPFVLIIFTFSASLFLMNSLSLSLFFALTLTHTYTAPALSDILSLIPSDESSIGF